MKKDNMKRETQFNTPTPLPTFFKRDPRLPFSFPLLHVLQNMQQIMAHFTLHIDLLRFFSVFNINILLKSIYSLSEMLLKEFFLYEKKQDIALVKAVHTLPLGQ